MANFYVTHHRYPSNPQLFTVNVTKVVKKGGEENSNFSPSFPSGESYWELFIYTTGKDVAGEDIDPIYVDVLGSEEEVDELIDSKVSYLCSLIDWSQQGTYSEENDVDAPVIVNQNPSPGETSVGINSSISIRVQDKLPANGLDLSSVWMKVDGILVNPEVRGNKYDATFFYSPRAVYDS